MTEIVLFILLVICIEAVTEILVDSAIFEKPRLFLSRMSTNLGVLVHCGYCTSVWVSGFFGWFFAAQIFCFFPSFWISYIVTVFVLHRLSNIFHELVSKWFSRRPITLAVHKTERVIMPTVNYEQKNDI